jgi:hypothetical protein
VADLGVGFDKFTAELLKIAELRHFSLRLAGRGHRRQRLGEGFAVNFMGEPEMGAVARLAGPMAATVWLAAPTRGVGDGTRAQITELSELLSDRVSTLL